jgi:hypothetical protein
MQKTPFRAKPFSSVSLLEGLPADTFEDHDVDDLRSTLTPSSEASPAKLPASCPADVVAKLKTHLGCDPETVFMLQFPVQLFENGLHGAFNKFNSNRNGKTINTFIFRIIFDMVLETLSCDTVVSTDAESGESRQLGITDCIDNVYIAQTEASPFMRFLFQMKDKKMVDEFVRRIQRRFINSNRARVGLPPLSIPASTQQQDGEEGDGEGEPANKKQKMNVFVNEAKIAFIQVF